MERLYNASDLVGLKRNDLVALVERQPDKWPDMLDKFNRQKTNMDRMKHALLTGAFTTNEPLRQPATPDLHSPVLAVQSSGPIEGDKQNSEIQPSSDSLGDVLTSEDVENNTTETVAPERRFVVLLIEDTRRLVNERVSQRIEVSVINHDNCGIGEWQASAREVIDALQASLSAFKGPAKIGIPDREDPEYIQFFATITGPEYFDDTEPNPSHLIIPKNARLKLTVSHLGGVKIPAKRMRSESPSDHVAEILEWAKAKTEPTASLAATSIKKKSSQLTDDELTWLTERAKNTPGFDIFKKNHNQRLNNLDRANYWKFAAKFSAKYFKAQWPVGISLSGGITIKKSAIEAALEIKTTALAQAVNMARILDIYYDGPHRSEEVTKWVEESETNSESGGSDVLAKFLIQWEKDHPVV
ncbi:hypothetical protein B0H10DRAFT_2183144 [Mycena sp. CBHHK59/15]|nr:hypothetical protein B0H10DRAFT_2183144 [Mycena sp. CBHHK59/15]